MKTNTDKIGRQLNRFSTEGWIELVAEYRNSGLTLKSFAENKNIKPSTFSKQVNTENKNLNISFLLYPLCYKPSSCHSALLRCFKQVKASLRVLLFMVVYYLHNF
jgi:hypothetical protein